MRMTCRCIVLAIPSCWVLSLGIALCSRAHSSTTDGGTHRGTSFGIPCQSMTSLSICTRIPTRETKGSTLGFTTSVKYLDARYHKYDMKQCTEIQENWSRTPSEVVECVVRFPRSLCYSTRLVRAFPVHSLSISLDAVGGSIRIAKSKPS